MNYCQHPVMDSQGDHTPTVFDPMGIGHRECGKVATVKQYGFWYCERHADEIERLEKR